MEKPPLFLYYAAFFGIYKEGQIVEHDGKPYLIAKVEIVEDADGKGSHANVHIREIERR